MALIDVVKWEQNPNELCYKFPSSDLRLGTQLVVYPSQTAFFIKGGQIFDEFESGSYTLKTNNIPLLNKALNLPFGGDSPFQAEVWFINQITKLDMKWGTITPIQLEDPKYHIIVPVRAYGQYGIKVINPRVFLETLIGSSTSFAADKVNDYFKGKVVSFLNTTIARKLTIDQISILDINAFLLDISEYCNGEINTYFEKYGLSLVDFSIMSINFPQDDDSVKKLKDAKATLAQMNIAGRDVYQMQRSFDVLDKAAANEGAGTPFMGMGVGMGFGNAIGGMVAQNINTNPQPVPPPIPQETTWFVYVNGQQLAGQSISQMATMFMNGRINSKTLVWRAGMSSWVPIANVPELVGLVTPPAMPPEAADYLNNQG